MKKSITINIVLIVLSVLSLFACILIMPFFWKWYEIQLGVEDIEGIKESFYVVSAILLPTNMAIQGAIIEHKTRKKI